MKQALIILVGTVTRSAVRDWARRYGVPAELASLMGWLAGMAASAALANATRRR
jgi:hypothetical protein